MNKSLNIQDQRVKLIETYRRYISCKSPSSQKAGEAELFHGSYGSQLFDSRWKSKRLLIIARDGSQCVICKSGTGLQVHHRQYQFSKANKKFKQPWEYTDNLLITLCEKCHQKGHRQYKVPVVYI